MAAPAETTSPGADGESGSAGVGSSPPSRGGTRSTAYPAPVDQLIAELARLPGIGRRSAERLALHLLKAGASEALGLARAISDVKKRVRNCHVCFNMAEATHDGAVCGICADPNRDRSTILVVEQPRDLLSLEQTGMYRGVYHVLLGRISPLEGVGPGDLTMGSLLERIGHAAAGGVESVAVKEVILGLNPTLEGDGTGLYLAEQLARRGVRVSRLARGLPAGSTLEFASKAVLADAIQGRRTME